MYFSNIIHMRVLEQINLMDKTLMTTKLLDWFNMSNEMTWEEIKLPMNAEEMIKQTQPKMIDE